MFFNLDYPDTPAFHAICKNIQRKYPSMPKSTVQTKAICILAKSRRLTPSSQPKTEPVYVQLSLY